MLWYHTKYLVQTHRESPINYNRIGSKSYCNLAIICLPHVLVILYNGVDSAGHPLPSNWTYKSKLQAWVGVDILKADFWCVSCILPTPLLLYCYLPLFLLPQHIPPRPPWMVNPIPQIMNLHPLRLNHWVPSLRGMYFTSYITTCAFSSFWLLLQVGTVIADLLFEIFNLSIGSTFNNIKDTFFFLESC